MKTLSMDLRKRVLASCDKGDGTRQDIAVRFKVSLGMVKKLLAQRRRTGRIGPQLHLCGRKPKILGTHRARMRELLGRKPDMTLAELRDELGLECTVQAVFYALDDLGLTRRQRRSTPARRKSPPAAASRRAKR